MTAAPRPKKTHRVAEFREFGPLAVTALDGAGGTGCRVTFTDPAFPAALRGLGAVPSHARCGIWWPGADAHQIALRTVRGDIAPAVLLLDYPDDAEGLPQDAWGRPHPNPDAVRAEFRRLAAEACR